MATVNKTFISKYLYSTTALSCLAAKEIFKLYFLFEMSPYKIQAVLYAGIWIWLQTIFATVTGKISDKHCRKKTLLATVFLSIFTLIFLKFNYLILAAIFDGIFCNITPVARTAFIDVNYTHGESKRPFVAFSYVIQSLPWIVIPTIQILLFKEDNTLNMLPISIASWIIVSIFALIFFKDTRDKDNQSDNFSTLTALKKIVQHRIKIKVIISFILMAICYHTIQYYLDDHYSSDQLSKAYLLLGIGIFLGNLIHLFVKFETSLKNISLVYLFCFLIFLFGWISSLFFKQSYLSNFSYYLPFTFAGSFALPLVYDAFTLNTSIHEDGFLFGVLESALNFAEALGPEITGFSIFNFYYFMTLLGASVLASADFKKRFIHRTQD
jgi:predicted MFS family arabinose efflux permease